MPRYRLTLEYDGTRFHGLQRQEPGVVTVQETVEAAVFQICQEKTTLMAAGRTDSGVHAKGQVVHIDLQKPLRADRLRDALNFYIRDLGASVLDATEVPETFHARFSAQSRSYEYIILNRRPPSPLMMQRAWHVIPSLDVQNMQKGANFLIGHHDFTSFRDSECQSNSPEKTLDIFRFERSGDVIKAYLKARSFLHHQVRIMMGTIKLVGEGKWPAEKVKDVLMAKDRRLAGPTAPACGLYFMDVDYPD